jgi:hypothetical protein
MSLTRITKSHGTSAGWVDVASVAQASGGLDITVVLRSRKKGPVFATWNVRCRGVREFEFSDLTGGGIRLYSSDHPAAKQYVAGGARLSCRTGGAGTQAWLALAAAHVAAVDDWVPLERYLPSTPPATGTLVVRAPAFLVRVYAQALRRIGLRVRVLSTKRRAKQRGRSPKVLHLGNSFVVADAFEVRERLANKQMQRTKRG